MEPVFRPHSDLFHHILKPPAVPDGSAALMPADGDCKVGHMRSFVVLLLALVSAGCTTSTERGLPRATVQEQRAEKMFEAGQIAEARALFEQAARMNPQPFLSTIGLARCGIRAGDRDLMEAAIRLAYASAPKTPEAQDMLGRTHLAAAKVSTGGLRMQHAATAGSMFSAASREAPELPKLAYHTGMAELLSGRMSSAVTFLEVAMAEDPDFADAAHALVIALRRLGRKGRMIAVLDGVAEKGRLTPELAEHLAWAKAPNPDGRGPGRRLPRHLDRREPWLE